MLFQNGDVSITKLQGYGDVAVIYNVMFDFVDVPLRVVIIKVDKYNANIFKIEVEFDIGNIIEALVKIKIVWENNKEE